MHSNSEYAKNLIPVRIARANTLRYSLRVKILHFVQDGIFTLFRVAGVETRPYSRNTNIASLPMHIIYASSLV